MCLRKNIAVKIKYSDEVYFLKLFSEIVAKSSLSRKCSRHTLSLVVTLYRGDC